jgi:uncharacterized membrane protein YeaQ/YmgE (transglycosylase-associated protein family)
MGIVIWIIIGVVGGWLACRLTRRRQFRDYLWNIVVGIIGAIAGGFATNLVIFRPPFDPNLQSTLISVFGAALFLIVFNAIRREPDDSAIE